MNFSYSPRNLWVLAGVVVVGVALFIAYGMHKKDAAENAKKLAVEFAGISELYDQELGVTPSKQQDLVLPDNMQSIDLFVAFAKAHPKDPVGWEAAIRSVNYYLKKNNNSKTQEIIELVAPYISKAPVLQIKLRSILAGLYADAGDYQKAVESLLVVENTPGNPLPAQAYLFHAQLLHLLNKNTEAREILNQIAATPQDNSSESLNIQKQAKLWLSYLSAF